MSRLLIIYFAYHFQRRRESDSPLASLAIRPLSLTTTRIRQTAMPLYWLPDYATTTTHRRLYDIERMQYLSASSKTSKRQPSSHIIFSIMYIMQANAYCHAVPALAHELIKDIFLDGARGKPRGRW